MIEILVLYYSRHGSTLALAQHICRGVEKVDGVQAKLRTVPEISANSEKTVAEIPEQGAIYASNDDLIQCGGLILGSPTQFGNMASPLKYFIDSSSSVWLAGKLAGKPAAVFTSSSSLHGGNEATLLTMMLPLFHHGMLLMGLPYSEASLNNTKSGGSPYGASHVAGSSANNILTTDEKNLAIALGERIASYALALEKK